MKRNKIIISLILIILVLSASVSVSAKEVEYAPYYGYEYNGEGESVLAPVTYNYSTQYLYSDIGTDTPLSEPSDMCFIDDRLYVLDAGNSRILMLSADMKLIKIVADIKDGNGNSYDFTGAQGLTVDSEGDIYIADTQNERILCVDSNNRLKLLITKPDTTIVGYDFSFDVIKVLVDKQGNLLASAQSVNNGAFVFDCNGDFKSFYGRNTVKRTVDVVLNFIRKRFMTREQIQKLQNYSPATISNFDIDADGFIYTVEKTGNGIDEPSVRKLNFKGSDVIKSEGIIDSFGDLETDRGELSSNNYTSFADIDIDDIGFMHILDEGRGKIFEYTANGQLVGVFGGFGDQKGMFKKPVAVETYGKKVFVLDSVMGGIIEFTPTDYLKALHEAFLELDSSDPEKSILLWQKALERNTNSEYPYYGLATAYEKLGNYGEAMKNFKLASAKEEYSEAFREYRKQVASEHLVLIILAAVGIIAAIILLIKVAKKYIFVSSEGAYSALENKYAIPLYVQLHPADGFSQFKYRKNLPSVSVSVGIVVAFFLVNILEFFSTGYIFNQNDPQDYTIFSTLIGSVILYLLFVVGNWAVCSMLDGNGKMKEIAAVTAYSLIPFIISKLINIALSHFLILDEAMILTIVSAVGIVWSGLVLLIGLSQIHQYYIGKTVLTVLITICAMVVIAVLVFLFFSMIQQVIFFANSLYDEIKLR
ncbi:MAG: YIP1 family protein [Acutalibacteraceae bacterium]